MAGIESSPCSFLFNGVSWNSCWPVNPEWNSNEAPIDRNDLMIMNNDSEGRGGLTGFALRITNTLQGGVGRQRNNAAKAIGGQKKTAGKWVSWKKKFRDDVTVLSDSTSRPLDMQNCLSTRPLSQRQRRKSMEATELIKASLPNVLYIFIECSVEVSDEINACSIYCKPSMLHCPHV